MDCRVDYNGGKIFYTISGAGEIVVLLHGYLESSAIWNDFANTLEKSYRVINIDLPGNGLSSIFQQEHTMCFLADAVFAVLDKEAVKKAVVVGHSLGGYVALSMVERFPERLSGYVLFHSHPFADTDEVKKNRKREIDIVLSGKKEVIYPINIPKMFSNSNLDRFALEVERSKEIASFHEAEGIVSIVKGMMNRKSREHVVTEGRVPLLIILGTKDNYIDYESVMSRISLPSNGSIETLSRSGHMGFIEEADRSKEIVTKFISSLKQ